MSTSFSLRALLKSLFFIPFRRSDHRIAPLLVLGWTLHMEMLFYAIFGIALKIMRKLREGACDCRDCRAGASWTRYGQKIRRVPGLVALMAAGASNGFLVLMDIHVLDSYGPGFRHVPDFLLRGVPASLILLAFLSAEEKFKFPALVLLIGMQVIR